MSDIASRPARHPPDMTRMDTAAQFITPRHGTSRRDIVRHDASRKVMMRHETGRHCTTRDGALGLRTTARSPTTRHSSPRHMARHEVTADGMAHYGTVSLETPQPCTICHTSKQPGTPRNTPDSRTPGRRAMLTADTPRHLIPIRPRAGVWRSWPSASQRGA